jgi:hypothetical protein
MVAELKGVEAVEVGQSALALVAEVVIPPLT